MSTADGDVATSRVKNFLALGIVLAVAISLVGSSALAASAPPFEPDPDSLGGLRFFNAAGVEITSGNVADAPFAAYIQTSGVGRLGDTRATLFGYLPKNGVDTSGWAGEPLTASTTYPNSGAPAPLNASPLPLVSLVAGDGTLAQLQATFPNTAPAGDPYQGLYQLRVKTSGPGQLPGATYYSADIQIVGTAWSVVYSNLPPAPTTTTTSTTTTSTTTSTVPPTTSTTTSSTTTSTVPPTTSTTTSTVPPTTTSTTSTVPPTTTSTTSTTTSTTEPPTTSTTTEPPTTTSTTTTSTTAPPTTTSTTSTTTTTTEPPTTSTTTEPPTTTSTTTTSTTAPPTTTSTTTTSTTAPPNTPSVTVTQTSAPIGGSFALSSKGWAAGEKIDVAIHSTPVALGQLTVDETGSIAGSFVVPAGIEPGSHTITLSGKAASGEVVTVSASFEVTGVSAQADSDGAGTVVSTGSGTGSSGNSSDEASTGASLAYTGASVRPLLALAIACAAVGSALMLISRRRRTDR